MGVSSYTVTQYFIKCDCCGIEEVCADNNAEGVHSKQQAIKWSGMHKLSDGTILCDECYKLRKQNK